MQTRSPLKILLPVLVLAVAGLAYYSMVSSKTERPRPQLTEKVWQIEAISATRQSVSPLVTLYGRIESPELLQAAAPGGGIVERVYVRNGLRVGPDEPLVRLDQRDFEVATLQAEADLREVESQIAELQVRHRSNQAALATERELLSLAEAEVERLVQLQARNLTSDTALNAARSDLGRRALEVNARQFEVDSYPARLQTLEARRDRNRARLTEARLARERSELRAPFDALISSVDVAAGDRVSLGQVLVSLYPLNSLEVRAHLPSKYIGSVQRALTDGQLLTAELQNRDLSKSLELIRLAGESESTGIDAYFAIDASELQFRPGELLALNLKLPQENDVIALPYQAIYGNSRVYKIVDDRLQAVDVVSAGQTRSAQGAAQVLVRSDQINIGDRIAATHLPNAVSGLKVTTVEN